MKDFDSDEVMDGIDPLRGFRERFYFPQIEGRDALYFTGDRKSVV